VARLAWPKVLLYSLWHLGQAAALSALTLTAFAIYQLYAFVLYCTPGRLTMAPHVEQFVRDRDYVTPGAVTSPWCNDTLPTSYGYVQDHYWDVGLLRYWRWRQIPNFLLALPTVLLVLSGTATYLRRWTLAVLRRAASGTAVNSRLLPYVLHAAALTGFMVTCGHVQVTTRVVASSSPVLYWFAARLIHGPPAESERRKHRTKRGSGSVLSWLVQPPGRAGFYTQLYFLVYAVLGTCLFVNGLPWT